MKKRLISFVMLLALCASLLCACGSDGYGPTGHLRLKGRDVEVDWVMKVDGEEISADEYRYFFMNTAFSYISDTEGEYEWTDEENLSVIATAEEYVVLNKALFDLAEGFGIVVTEADEAEIQKTISETASGFSGREEYLSVLASNYITEEYYSTLLRSTVIQEKLSEYLTGVDGVYGLTEDEMVAIMQEEYVCVRYLMLNPDEEGKTDQKDRMAVYASAIKDKSDLITHINLYSEDVSMKNNAEG
ncbi:MAG: SurA N-terminal domain-containing protein, partial [Clostridia bacterium]|nr:SurA N-terminal domain-containing protein [Clostridia bacterium]